MWPDKEIFEALESWIDAKIAFSKMSPEQRSATVDSLARKRSAALAAIESIYLAMENRS
jgi:hypothetical protein